MTGMRTWIHLRTLEPSATEPELLMRSPWSRVCRSPALDPGCSAPSSGHSSARHRRLKGYFASSEIG